MNSSSNQSNNNNSNNQSSFSSPSPTQFNRLGSRLSNLSFSSLSPSDSRSNYKALNNSNQPITPTKSNLIRFKSNNNIGISGGSSGKRKKSKKRKDSQFSYSKIGNEDDFEYGQEEEDEEDEEEGFGYDDDDSRDDRIRPSNHRIFPIGSRPESIDLLTIQDPDDLFQSFTIREIKSLEMRARADAEKKREELRQMVGERYRDLLSVADSIVRMKNSSEQLLDSLYSARDQCDPEDLRNKESKLGIERSSSAANSSSRTSYILATLVKLIIDLSEHIWRSLERHDFLTAARFEGFGRIISTELSNGTWDESGMTEPGEVFECFPIVSRQSEALSQLGPQISSGARAFLRKWEINHQETQAALVALVLLDNATISESLRSLLNARRAALGSLIVSSRLHFSWIDRVKASIQLIFSTLSHVQKIFESGHFVKLLRAIQNGNSSPSELKPSDLETGEEIKLPSIISLLPNAHQSMKYIPSPILNFSPFIDSLNRTETIDFKSQSRSWFGKCQDDLIDHIESQLNQQHQHYLHHHHHHHQKGYHNFNNSHQGSSSDGLVEFRKAIDQVIMIKNDKDDETEDEVEKLKLELKRKVMNCLKLKFDELYLNRLNSLKAEVLEIVKDDRFEIERNPNWIFEEKLPNLIESNNNSSRNKKKNWSGKRFGGLEDEDGDEDDDEGSQEKNHFRHNDDDEDDEEDEDEGDESEFLKRFSRSIRNRIQGKKSFQNQANNYNDEIDDVEDGDGDSSFRNKDERFIIRRLESVGRRLRIDFEKFYYSNQTYDDVYDDYEFFVENDEENDSSKTTTESNRRKRRRRRRRRSVLLSIIKTHYFKIGIGFVEELLKGLEEILETEFKRQNFKKGLLIGELSLQIYSTRLTFMKNISLHKIFKISNNDKNNLDNKNVKITSGGGGGEEEDEEDDNGYEEDNFELVKKFEDGLNLIIFKSFKNFLITTDDNYDPIGNSNFKDGGGGERLDVVKEKIYFEFLNDFYEFYRFKRIDRNFKSFNDSQSPQKKPVIVKKVLKPSRFITNLIENLINLMMMKDYRQSSSSLSYLKYFKFFKFLRSLIILKVLKLMFYFLEEGEGKKEDDEEEKKEDDHQSRKKEKKRSKPKKVKNDETVKDLKEGSKVEEDDGSKDAEEEEEEEEEEEGKNDKNPKGLNPIERRQKIFQEKFFSIDNSDDENDNEIEKDQKVLDILCLKRVIFNCVITNDRDNKDREGNRGFNLGYDREGEEVVRKVEEKIERFLIENELKNREERMKRTLKDHLSRVEKLWWIIFKHEIPDQRILQKDERTDKELNFKGYYNERENLVSSSNDSSNNLRIGIEVVKPGNRFGLISIY